jgi:hypothetical protein
MPFTVTAFRSRAVGRAPELDESSGSPYVRVIRRLIPRPVYRPSIELLQLSAAIELIDA